MLKHGLKATPHLRSVGVHDLSCGFHKVRILKYGLQVTPRLRSNGVHDLSCWFCKKNTAATTTPLRDSSNRHQSRSGYQPRNARITRKEPPVRLRTYPPPPSVYSLGAARGGLANADRKRQRVWFIAYCEIENASVVCDLTHKTIKIRSPSLNYPGATQSELPQNCYPELLNVICYRSSKILLTFEIICIRLSEVSSPKCSGDALGYFCLKSFTVSKKRISDLRSSPTISCRRRHDAITA